MAIRFRFRSSANYDSLLIEGQPSISIRDLKAKIVNNKNLNICQDFDLVFSDAETGQGLRLLCLWYVLLELFFFS